MRRIGKCAGLDVYNDHDDMYYVRVPVEQSGFGAVHDLHKRIPVGRFKSFADATKAITRKHGGR